MADISNRSDPAKKCYTLSISEEEIERQISIIFGSQICSECGQDHSFKNSFESVRTSIDYLSTNFRNRISMEIPSVEAKTPKESVIKK
jgi:hypothetical protein